MASTSTAPSRSRNAGQLRTTSLAYRPCSRRKPRVVVSQAGAASSSSPGPPTSSARATVNVGASPREQRRLPVVDWSRQHLQVLFVDRSDTVRGRLGAGLFERIAEWNGYGRAMVPWTVGLEANQRASERSLGKMAALMSGASALGVSPRLIARPAEQFELEDLDRWDLIVTMDQAIQAEVLREVAATDYYRDHAEHYRNKVVLLSDFAPTQPDSTLLAVGGLALLPLQLSFLLRAGLDSARAVVDIESPQLASESGQRQWNQMVRSLILGTAALVKFLIDATPSDEGRDMDM